MSRDASPERTKSIIETETTLFSVYEKSQQLLIYFGVVLECDVPIIEALFYTKITQLSPKGPDFQQRLYNAMQRHLQEFYPSWCNNKGVSDDWFGDNMWRQLYKGALGGVRIEGRGLNKLLCNLHVVVTEERIKILCTQSTCIPTMGRFFATLDMHMNSTFKLNN